MYLLPAKKPRPRLWRPRLWDRATILEGHKRDNERDQDQSGGRHDHGPGVFVRPPLAAEPESEELEPAEPDPAGVEPTEPAPASVQDLQHLETNHPAGAPKVATR